MAEQEMEYRVDLFNRLSFTSTSYTHTGLSPLHLALAVAEGCSCICAGWCQAVLRSAWTNGEPSDLCNLITLSVQLCGSQCKLPRCRYKEGELNVGENSCIDRCSSKYWQARHAHEGELSAVQSSTSSSRVLELFPAGHWHRWADARRARRPHGLIDCLAFCCYVQLSKLLY